MLNEYSIASHVEFNSFGIKCYGKANENYYGDAYSNRIKNK